MIPPDLALVQLINRTATAYVQNAPAFITYRELTHVSAPSLGRTQDINRSVEVRQSDDHAVMQDLPQGAVRTGQAFPIIPYFDPLQSFGFDWFANLKNVSITLQRTAVGVWPMPSPDPSAAVVVPYFSFWVPQYAPDSTAARLHFIIDPTPAMGHGLYAREIIEDPQTQLPARIVLADTESDTTITLDYQMRQGHWVITHGTFTATEHVGPLSFKVTSDTAYDQFTFPAAAPDPRLAPRPQKQKPPFLSGSVCW